MKYLNVPKYIQSLGYRKVPNVILVGTLVGEIGEHPIFSKNTLSEGATFALIDLVGIEIAHDTIKHTHYVSGHAIAVVNKSAIEESKAKLKTPKDRRFVKVSGTLHMGRFTNDLVYMVEFAKGLSGGWVLLPVNVATLGSRSFPEFYKVIRKASKKDWKYDISSVKPSDYIDCCASVDFTEFLERVEDSTVEVKEKVAKTKPSEPVAKSVVVDEDIPCMVKWDKASTQPTTTVPKWAASHLRTSNTSKKDGVEVNPTPTWNTSDAYDLPISNYSLNSSFNNTLGVGSRVTKAKAITRENRADFRPKNKSTLRIVQSAIDEAELKVTKLIDELNNIKADNHIVKDALRYFGQQINKYYELRYNGGGLTGRALLKNVLTKVCSDANEVNEDGVMAIDNILKSRSGRERVLEILCTGGVLEGECRLYKVIAQRRFYIYIKAIEHILSISQQDIARCVKKKDLTAPIFLTLLHTNPYKLCLVDHTLKVENLDKLAMAFGVNREDKEVVYFRNVAYLHNTMLNHAVYPINNSTCVGLYYLKSKVSIDLKLSETVYKRVQTFGTVINLDRVYDFQNFIHADTVKDNFALPKEGWVVNHDRKIYTLRGTSGVEDAIKAYVASGLGVTIKSSWIGDYTLLKKEFTIYNKAYTIKDTSYIDAVDDVEDEDIEECIKSFEAMKNKALGVNDFKLEERQKDAIRLIKQGIFAVTGPAGSGKTTTAEAIVYALEKLLDIPSSEIMFCAPTGKAANRLKEVVKRPTRTIHSLFGIGINTSYALTSRASNNHKGRKISVLIVDESSMIDLNLMHNLFEALDSRTRVIFLGDVEQLPPITFGKPFANLLQFLPCVVLNVTKRASDTSGITLNAKSLIYESDTQPIKDLTDTPDFKLVQVDDPQIAVRQVVELCKYHIGLLEDTGGKQVSNIGVLSPDDIQVVSPINRQVWGVHYLNHILQDLFNPKQGANDYVVYEKLIGIDKTKEAQEKARIEGSIKEFRVGDRVIHTLNDASRQRFMAEKSGVLVEIESKGVMNGDIGKVVAIVPSNQIRVDYIPAEDLKDDDSEKKPRPKLGVSDKTYYLLVKYQDVDVVSGDSIEFLIAYELNFCDRIRNEINCKSEDLNSLDLAYALTVHKLQGSQVKLVIGLLFSRGTTPSFISRNLIYTLVTRAQAGCYLIGDVTGSESAISKGRLIEQTTRRNTLLDRLCE